MFRYIVSTFLILFAFGCSDYNLSSVPVLDPEIEVTPEFYDFGALNADGEMGELSIYIYNVGNDVLDIHDVYLNIDDSSFTLSNLQTYSLDPQESTELIVSYDPDTYEFNSDIVSIFSNDEDEGEVQVPIGGSGDAPVINITPSSFDFGTVYLGCEEDLEVMVGNIGNVDLIIDDLEYFASVPVDFSLSEYETTYGPLPWSIAPGYAMVFGIGYAPLDLQDDSAYLEVTSNDPVRPVVTSIHDAMGDYEDVVADSFEQQGDATSDILFVIDNSGSMSRNQTSLANNFDSFINVFSSSGVDFQIGFITTDDPTLVDGKIIDSTTADPITEVNDIIDTIGTHGSAYEKGLEMSYLATDTGGDASPGSVFLRDTAKLVIIYVSDEPDWSSATYSPTNVAAQFRSLKTSDAMVVAHAVAGDYPSGCNSGGTYATFGDGYYDVVNDLGGSFMSICATDWGNQMDTLARESMASIVFHLSDSPIEETIEVEVDGVPVTAWTYDVSINSVIFDTAPAEGSTIDIEYAIWSDCSTQ